MGTDTSPVRITGKVQGRDIVLSGPLSKDEIRDQVWWWRDPADKPYDDSERDVITTLGGYYEVPEDFRTPEGTELVDMVHAELNPDPSGRAQS
ncbi:hypothetical protein NX794_16320 [Streptomyces sp. LP11]|uniref:Uncharacterized protein n=1 Tax=Streptomyces pyxinicus TaxID=2970331 RepID=A0ABT2B2L7_9ACTN|nr:hypothetical protein [Streptomyces sp. LP11]MCS0602764.1 hypothetical protein [Streptomyces sp. LP11]